MGCISSKRAAPVSASPALEYAVSVGDHGSVFLEPSLKNSAKTRVLEEKKDESDDRSRALGKSSRSSTGRFSLSFRLGNLHNYVESEQVAAGWPAWLSAVASEAVQGWLPLRSDAFEKLEKIGQGTYSSVFQARDIETGRMVALKKVRFDNFQPESIRFMAREIMILRRLDHPNIMKLEGLITSRLSYTIYLVFEYMEHDLAGLLSDPDIKFSDSQIKCYMQQLLYGIEHCHLRGIMHRDVKASNILVNNEGILKLADFGLANSLSTRHRQQLTSRVVTLWYRPPELLLGSTNYGVSVDLWSVGCLFAELLIGKPILKGRTEVEQLHKIFKLCGSPPEEYWKKSKLPHATMFKPYHPYESTLRERCKEFPKTAVNLIETFLSVEPHKRGTASSALMSEYFSTKPYACDPSSLPKYTPTKEIDAKTREEARRKRAGVVMRGSGPSRKPRRVQKTLQDPNSFSNLAPKEEVQSTFQFSHRNNGNNLRIPKAKGGAARGKLLKPSFDTVSEVSQMTSVSRGDIAFSGPLQVTASSGFAWARRRQEDGASTRSYNSRDSDSYMVARHAMQKQRTKLDRPDSFDVAAIHRSHKLSEAPYDQDEMAGVENNVDQQERVDFSGSLLSQSHGADEILRRHDSHIRQAVRRSRLHR